MLYQKILEWLILKSFDAWKVLFCRFLSKLIWMASNTVLGYKKASIDCHCYSKFSSNQNNSIHINFSFILSLCEKWSRWLDFNRKNFNPNSKLIKQKRETWKWRSYLKWAFSFGDFWKTLITFSILVLWPSGIDLNYVTWWFWISWIIVIFSYNQHYRL